LRKTSKIVCAALIAASQMATITPASAHGGVIDGILAPMARSLAGFATVLSDLMPVTDTIAPSAGMASLPTPAPIRLQPAISTPFSHGIFDSVAIPAGHVAMTMRWVELNTSDHSAFFTDGCETQFTSACTSTFGQTTIAAYETALTESPFEALTLVNREVNSAIAYQSDAGNWGVGDYWATPAEIARNGRGDCEDYATAKMWLLLALGFSPDQLQLVILQDTRRGLYHAVLAVHLDGQRYILDNLSNTVRRDSQIGNYMPLISFVADRTFIHGFDARRTATAALPTDLTTVQPG